MLRSPSPMQALKVADNDICRLWFTIFQPNQDLPLAWLNSAELNWLQDKSLKRRANFAWSRALLRKLCCGMFEVKPEQVLISLPGAHKTTLLVAEHMVFCSVSHSQQLVAVAISTAADIGLDVELISSQRDKRPYADVYPALQHWCESDPLFYQRWTAIEASIKLNGGQLFQQLALQNPDLAPYLRHWQQQNYQFCIASGVAIESCGIVQVDSQNSTLIDTSTN